MKIVFILFTHFILRTQYAETKEITPLKKYLGHLSQNQLNAIYATQSRELANLDINKVLSINDLWNKIKDSVANAWNAIKDIANKTKDKINAWVQDIKKRAEEVAKDIQAKLEVLKEKLNKFIQSIKDTAGDVKQCIQEDKDAIQELLKQIGILVSTCIAESVKNASVLDSYQSRLVLDDIEFVNGAEDKINKCIHIQDVDNADECLNKVRGEIYDDMEHTENGIMETRSVSRDLVEDALETILQCAADGIIGATEAITKAVLKIVKCAMSEEKPDTTRVPTSNP